MKLTIGVCLLASTIAGTALAQQDPTKPVLRKGVSVQMPVSNQAIEMRDADNEDATVVTATADGKLYLGARPVRLSDLGKLSSGTVYVKADARTPYQNMLTLLDALRPHSVVLLTSARSNAETMSIAPPYGVKVILGSQ